MSRLYFGAILLHTPERSGLPSAVRGAAAVRFGFPPAARGMPGVAWFSHCAESGYAMIAKKKMDDFMFPPLTAAHCTAFRLAFQIVRIALEDRSEIRQ